jgi:hypothetical protein
MSNLTPEEMSAYEKMVEAEYKKGVEYVGGSDCKHEVEIIPVQHYIARCKVCGMEGPPVKTKEEALICKKNVEGGCICSKERGLIKAKYDGKNLQCKGCDRYSPPPLIPYGNDGGEESSRLQEMIEEFTKSDISFLPNATKEDFED